MTDPTKKDAQNSAHVLVSKALEELGKLAHFTMAEIEALAEKLYGKL